MSSLELPAREISDGPTPKHAQLHDILEELCNTTLKPGDILPGERLLEETYGVSRITVRRAIGDLVAAGKLRRVRGKGLVGDKSGLWRWRVGDYRVIVSILDEAVVVNVIDVGHRRNIYL